MQANKSNNHKYNKKLKSVANSLRKSMTKAEACLWKYCLRARQMKGYQFRRQRPVLNYVVDFMCKELMLIIEVDGITHSHEDVAENDIIRQKSLEDAGFTVLRFEDDEVLFSINSVYQEIKAWISEEEAGLVHPLHPRQRGTLSEAS